MPKKTILDVLSVKVKRQLSVAAEGGRKDISANNAKFLSPLITVKESQPTGFNILTVVHLES